MKRSIHAPITRNQVVCMGQEAKMRRENVTITILEDVYMIRQLDVRKLTVPFSTLKMASQTNQKDVYMIRPLDAKKLTAPFFTVKMASQTFQMLGLQKRVLIQVPKIKVLLITWLF